MEEAAFYPVSVFDPFDENQLIVDIDRKPLWQSLCTINLHDFLETQTGQKTTDHL
jgi:hypothetical protein